VIVWKVVFAGVASVKVAVLQLLGPELVTTCVYVMFAPAVTGLGVPLFVTARSQVTVTGVTTVVLLFAVVGSPVVAATEEFAVIDATVTVEGTPTTTMMSAAVPEAKLDGSLQTTLPVVAPTAGDVQVHPAGAVTDSNVVLFGMASVKLAPTAAAGPLFVMVCV
jgi:hypothetical protein